MTKQHIDAETNAALRDLCVHATKLGLRDFYLGLLGIDEMSVADMRKAIDVAARSKGSSANASDGDKERQAARQKAIAETAYAQHYPLAPHAKDGPPEFVGGSVEDQLLAQKGAAVARRLWQGPPSRTN